MITGQATPRLCPAPLPLGRLPSWQWRAHTNVILRHAGAQAKHCDTPACRLAGCKSGMRMEPHSVLAHRQEQVAVFTACRRPSWGARVKVALSSLSGSSQGRTEGESEDIELPMLPNTDPLSPPTSPVVQDGQLQPAKDQRSFPAQPQVGKFSNKRHCWLHGSISMGPHQVGPGWQAHAGQPPGGEGCRSADGRSAAEHWPACCPQTLSACIP